MKREIVATFEQDSIRYARVKETRWFLTEYYTVFLYQSIYWKRVDTGEIVRNLDQQVLGFNAAKQLGDNFESKTERKFLQK